MSTGKSLHPTTRKKLKALIILKQDFSDIQQILGRSYRSFIPFDKKTKRLYDQAWKKYLRNKQRIEKQEQRRALLEHNRTRAHWYEHL